MKAAMANGKATNGPVPVLFGGRMQDSFSSACCEKGALQRVQKLRRVQHGIQYGRGHVHTEATAAAGSETFPSSRPPGPPLQRSLFTACRGKGNLHAAAERNGNGNSMEAFPNDMETFP